MPNIYYNFNDASIRPDAQTDLSSLADFLIQYPTTEIELISHTDSRGSDRYNNRLSQRRAENAVNFLIKKGINRNRLVPIGNGETQLRNTCNDLTTCSEADHQFNRRTEVKITKMDAPITIKFINNLPSYISEAPKSSKYSGRSNTNISPSNPSSTEIDLDEGKDEYDPEGDYKVIAGVFAIMNNAEKRLVEVRALGFNNADILKLGNSDESAFLTLKLVEIIGEDEIHSLDSETIYFITHLLNLNNLKKIRNDILISALPQRN